jgi:hypothetical protein
MRPRADVRREAVDDHGHRVAGRSRTRPARSPPRRGCRAPARPCRAGCGLPWASPERCRCRATCRSRRRRDHPFGRLGDGVEIGALLGEGARDLVDEERARHAARLRQVGQRDVVVHDDHADLEPLRPRPFGGEAEVQPVAGVVLHDQEAARLARHGEDAGEHRVDRGRGEDLAADGRRQHPLPHEARVARLVPRAAARDERDLRAVPVGADHHLDVRIAVEPREAAARRAEHPVDRFGDERFLGVDELSHLVLLRRSGRRQRRSKGGSSGFDRDGVAGFERVCGSVSVTMSCPSSAGAGASGRPDARPARPVAGAPVALPDMFGAQADGAAPCGAPAEERRGQRVDPRQAEAARHVEADRVLVDLARRAELHEPALRRARRHGSPWSSPRSGRGSRRGRSRRGSSGCA